jgi:phosphoribosyl 1,2-cyclic phosphodiesterase
MITQSMTVRFWGVRGSIPSPGASTTRYGGNTSCVSVHFPGNRIMIFDAGTGVRNLGNALAGDAGEMLMLLSHSHWDHIQGFPFFAPIYQAERKVYVVPFHADKAMMCTLLSQMDGAHFPVSPENLPSQVECIQFQDIPSLFKHDIGVQRISTNHPGGGLGYRVSYNGRSVVYLTDNELNPPYERATDPDAFAVFCRKADLLIHDAQYLEEDMPKKRGWGHSLVDDACRLAAAADAKHLILYHHDPERTDSELDSIQENARMWFAERHPSILCTVACEGMVIDV